VWDYLDYEIFLIVGNFDEFLICWGEFGGFSWRE
jgi:hypothetical protein